MARSCRFPSQALAFIGEGDGNGPTVEGGRFSFSHVASDLEMKSQLRGQRARCDVMGSGEGRQEVVNRDPIGDVDGRQLETHLVALAVEQVVVADREIKKMTGRNPGRVVLVVFRSGCGDGKKCRSILRRRTKIGAETRTDGTRRCRTH